MCVIVLVKVTSNTRNIFIEITSSQGIDVCKKVMEELLSSLLLMGIGQRDPLPPVQPLQTSPSSDAVTSDSHGDAAAAENDAEEDDDDLDEISTLSLTAEHTLVVQQVKIQDASGALKVVYPSRIDLQSECYRVIRDYE